MLVGIRTKRERTFKLRISKPKYRAHAHVYPIPALYVHVRNERNPSSLRFIFDTLQISNLNSPSKIYYE